MTPRLAAGTPSRSIAVATVAAAAVGLSMAVDARFAPVMVIALLGGWLVGTAVAYAETDVATTARKSVGLTVGTALLLAAWGVGTALGPAWLLAPVGFVSTLVLGADPESPADVGPETSSIVVSCWLALIVAFGLPLVVPLLGGLGSLSLGIWTDLFPSTLARIVLLQLLLLALLGLYHAGSTVLSDRILGEDRSAPDAGGWVPPHFAEGIAVVCLQLVVLVPVFPVDVPALFDRGLSMTGVAGAAISTVIDGGYLHLLLAALAVPPLAVLAGECCRLAVAASPADGPRKLLAKAAGAIAVAVPFGLAVLVLSLMGPVDVYGITPIDPAAIWLFGHVGLALSLAVVLVVELAIPQVFGVVGDQVSLVPAGLLLALAVAAAVQGDRVLVPVAGIAAAILVWDVHSNGTTLGRQLGEHARSERAELPHVAGSVAVALVGIGLAAASRYVLDPVALGLSSRQSLAALLLVLVAVLALGRLLVPPTTGDAAE